jgi:predicted nucleotidyltransferase
VLEADPGDVVAAWLFGSVARGEAGPSSDVDVALLTEGPRPHTFAALPLTLEADLAQRLGRCVDVVLMRAAPVDLVHRIMRDGVLLLDRDPSVRIAFEVDARNRYFDMVPGGQRYRSAERAS